MCGGDSSLVGQRGSPHHAQRGPPGEGSALHNVGGGSPSGNARPEVWTALNRQSRGARNEQSFIGRPEGGGECLEGAQGLGWRFGSGIRRPWKKSGWGGESEGGGQRDETGGRPSLSGLASKGPRSRPSSWHQSWLAAPPWPSSSSQPRRPHRIRRSRRGLHPPFLSPSSH